MEKWKHLEKLIQQHISHEVSNIKYTVDQIEKIKE